MALIATLVESAELDEALKAELKVLKAAITDAQNNRNRMAHMQVWQMSGIDLFGHPPKKDFMLLPLEWTDVKCHPDVVTTQKMQTYAAQFREVVRSIIEFEKLVKDFLLTRKKENT